MCRCGTSNLLHQLNPSSCVSSPVSVHLAKFPIIKFILVEDFSSTTSPLIALETRWSTCSLWSITVEITIHYNTLRLRGEMRTFSEKVSLCHPPFFCLTLNVFKQFQQNLFIFFLEFYLFVSTIIFLF